MTDKNDFDVLLDQIKEEFDFRFDKDLVAEIGITRQTLALWRRTGQIEKLREIQIKLHKKRLAQKLENAQNLFEKIEDFEGIESRAIINLYQKIGEKLQFGNKITAGKMFDLLTHLQKLEEASKG